MIVEVELFVNQRSQAFERSIVRVKKNLGKCAQHRCALVAAWTVHKAVGSAGGDAIRNVPALIEVLLYLS